MEMNKVQFANISQGNLTDALDKQRRTAKDISALNRRLDVAKKLSDSTLGTLGVSNSNLG
jgi:hypothetical protein